MACRLLHLCVIFIILYLTILPLMKVPSSIKIEHNELAICSGNPLKLVRSI